MWDYNPRPQAQDLSLPVVVASPPQNKTLVSAGTHFTRHQCVLDLSAAEVVVGGMTCNVSILLSASFALPYSYSSLFCLVYCGSRQPGLSASVLEPAATMTDLLRQVPPSRCSAPNSSTAPSWPGAKMSTPQHQKPAPCPLCWAMLTSSTSLCPFPSMDWPR